MTSIVSHPTPLVYFQTHGCKLNQADTTELSAQFLNSGFQITDSLEDADIYLINTCTVTHVADKKARQAIRSVRRKRPDCKIIVTGCYAERAENELKELSEIDLVIGNKEKPKIIGFVKELVAHDLTPCTTGSDLSQVLTPRISRTRGMVKIQEGCDQVCAYCIVPKVRGRERSISPDIILSQINDFVEGGYNEIVLTGTQLGSYGFEFDNCDLNSLLERILDETNLKRLRISSLQPQDINQKFLSICKNERVCPHFHMPLQSGSDLILAKMRRRYTSIEYFDAIKMIQDQIPNSSITADVIVGFPGESDNDFKDTFELCNEIDFSSLHVFPYSIRPGTSAQYFDNQIVSDIKSTRMKKLMNLSKVKERLYRENLIGEQRLVLWEECTEVGSALKWTGLTEDYLRVECFSSSRLHNQIRHVEIISLTENVLMVEILNAND